MTPSITACPPIFFNPYLLSLNYGPFDPTDRTEKKQETAMVSCPFHAVLSGYFFAYFFLNFSTLPSASTIFCFPVKKG
jgi:hypothetical protein